MWYSRLGCSHTSCTKLGFGVVTHLHNDPELLIKTHDVLLKTLAWDWRSHCCIPCSPAFLYWKWAKRISYAHIWLMHEPLYENKSLPLSTASNLILIGTCRCMPMFIHTYSHNICAQYVSNYLYMYVHTCYCIYCVKVSCHKQGNQVFWGQPACALRHHCSVPNDNMNQ